MTRMPPLPTIEQTGHRPWPLPKTTLGAFHALHDFLFFALAGGRRAALAFDTERIAAAAELAHPTDPPELRSTRAGELRSPANRAILPLQRRSNPAASYRPPPTLLPQARGSRDQQKYDDPTSRHRPRQSKTNLPFRPLSGSRCLAD